MHIGARIFSTGLLIAFTAFFALTTVSASAESDWAEVVVGEVTVQRVPDRGLNVIVNRFDASSDDSTAENVYFLQTNETPPVELPVHLEAAQVVVKDRELVVVAFGAPWALGFFLSEESRDDVEQMIRKLQEEAQGVVSPETIHLAAGFGLARHSGQFSLPLDQWPPADGPRLRQKSTSDDVTSEATCTTGGPGSSSASITCVNGISEGSVTCRKGYYACCYCEWYGEAKCECKEEGDGGGGYECPPCEPFEDN